MKNITFAFFTVLTLTFFGQNDLLESQNVKKHFLIAASTENYRKALKTATQLSRSLEMKFDQRNLKPIEKSGLTWSSEACEENGWDYPCYVARGREDGNFVSIEWSNAIAGFTKGYYVVIVSTQSDRNEKMQDLLTKVKRIKPSAYIKTAAVYLGCLH